MALIGINPGDPHLCLSLPSCGPYGEDGTYTDSNGNTVRGTRVGQGPLYGENTLDSSVAKSNYNALETTLRYQSHGSSLLLSYAYAKSIDEASNLGEQLNPTNERATRAISAWDIKQAFVATYSVALPFAAVLHRSNRIVNGRDLSGTTRPGFAFVFAFGPCSALTCGSGFNRLSAGLPIPPPTLLSAQSFTCVASASQLCFPQALNSTEPNYRDAYLEQFNLTVQQQFGANTFTLSYVGALGRHLGDAIANENLAPLGFTSAAVANLSRSFHATLPNLTNVPALLSDASSGYNGLQTTISRAMSNGLTFTATTTWAHNLDNAVQIGGGVTQTVISLDPASPYFHGRYDRSDSDLDQRNRFVFQGTYTPKYLDRFNGISGAALKGWTFNALSVWTTGLPYTVSNSSNVSFTTPNGAADRPNVVGDMRVLPSAAVGKIPYFNPAAFASQPSGTAGNARRNLMHGPAAQHVDAAIAKSFPIHEALHLNFRAEGFNLLNSAIFSNPTGTIGNANLGYITTTRADYQPRLFQFALRMEF